MSRRARITSAVVAGALAVGGCAGAGVALAVQARSTVPLAGDPGPGDGLDRWVLTLDPAAGARPVALELLSVSLPLAATAPGAGVVPPDASAVELLGGGGRAVQVGETSYYVTDRGAVAVTPGAQRDVLSPADFAQWASQRGVDAGLLPRTPAPASSPTSAPASSPTPAPTSAPSPSGPAAPAPAPATDAQLTALAEAPGVVSAQRLDDGRVLVAGVLDLTEALALPGVDTARRSPEVPVDAITDPLHARNGWALENTGSNAPAQAATAGADAGAVVGWGAGQGEGTVVAVLDTGYDTDHPDLAGALWTNPSEACGTTDTDGNGLAGDCHGWNYYTNSADLDNGANGKHGTWVAGTVAARANNGQGDAGLAPLTQVMPLVVGGGDSVQVPLAIQAIRYAVDHGADVINCSFGGVFDAGSLAQLRSAVAYAGSRGVLVVASAGNDATDRDVSPRYPANLTEDNAITVGASTASDGAASFSGYGATSVDLFAPGNLVLSTDPDGTYRLVSGTSFSAPYTAAAVAVYESARPDLSAAQVKAMLLADAERVPALAGRSVTGGRLDLTTLGATTGAARYTFSSMTGEVGALAPQVTVEAAPSAGAQALSLGLAMRVDGEPWALADAPITLGSQTLATGDDGFATFDVGATASATRTFAPRLSLAEGTYALVAQLLVDGAPVGRPYAAPLLVGAVGSTPPAAPGPTATGAPSSGAPSPGAPTSSPVSPSPVTTTTASAPRTTSSSTSTPRSTSTSAPSTSATATSPASPVPTATRSSAPSSAPSSPGAAPTSTPTATGAPTATSTARPAPGVTAAPSTPAPTTRSVTSAPSGAPTAPGPGGPAPSATGSTPSTPSPTTTPAPTPGGTRQFDEVGDFKITAMAPVRVPASGGTTVTVTGQGFTSSTAVHVDGAAAPVVAASATQLVFTAPARIVGNHAVVVHSGNRVSTLTGALTYYATGSGSASSSAPPTGGSTAPPSTSPRPSAPPSASASPSATGTPSAAPTQRTGPGGERLRRTALMSQLGGVWAGTCASSCSGTRL